MREPAGGLGDAPDVRIRQAGETSPSRPSTQATTATGPQARQAHIRITERGGRLSSFFWTPKAAAGRAPRARSFTRSPRTLPVQPTRRALNASGGSAFRLRTRLR